MEDQQLREEIQRFAIQNGNDILIWSFTNSGKFSIKSTYSYIKRQVAGPDLVFSKIWYQCFPLRASFFYWKILNQFMYGTHPLSILYMGLGIWDLKLWRGQHFLHLLY